MVSKKITGQATAWLPSGLYRSSAIPAAHENAHIADLKKGSPIAFKKIKTDIENVNLGAVATTSRMTAETQKEDVMKAAGNKWGDDSIGLANKHEKQTNCK